MTKRIESAERAAVDTLNSETEHRASKKLRQEKNRQKSVKQTKQVAKKLS